MFVIHIQRKQGCSMMGPFTSTQEAENWLVSDVWIETNEPLRWTNWGHEIAQIHPLSDPRPSPEEVRERIDRIIAQKREAMF